MSAIRRIILFASALLAMLAIGSWMMWPSPALTGTTSHDFGVVSIAPEFPVELRHTFELTNRRSHPVTIKAVKPACGCVTVVPELPTTIQPGGNFELPVVFTFRSAKKHVDIDVVIDPEEIVQLHLYAQGRFQPRLFAPPELALDENGRATLAISANIYHTDATPAPPTITAPPGVRATFITWASRFIPRDFHDVPCQWDGRIEVELTDSSARLNTDSTLVIELPPAPSVTVRNTRAQDSPEAANKNAPE